MALPETIRVKLSSEAAEGISLTAVVVREMPFRELFELMLPLTGKQAQRIRDLLARGTLVSGASRFRWAGWQTEPEEIEALLAEYPDAAPERRFEWAQCVKAVLRAGVSAVEVPQEAAAQRRLLRKESFWDVLAGVAAAASLAYVDYSYRERGDRYRVTLSGEQRQRVMAGVELLTYSALAQQIRRAAPDTLEFVVKR
jgi:hypothetical protein